MVNSTIRKILAITSTTGAVGAAGGLALAAWGWSELRKFQLHEYTVPLLEPGTLGIGKLGGGASGRKNDFRILHISDLHMIPGQQTKIEWVSQLADTKPDLVINTGDNLSHLKAVPEVLRALGPLLRVPGFFVFGTNDYFAPRPVNPFGYLLAKKRKVSKVELPWQGMRAAFLEHGWLDATHTRREIKVGPVKLAVTGVDDPHHDLDDYSRVAGPPNERADLALALSHAPEPRVLDQFAADGYHLTLCGHTHGGQLCLPGGRAIVTNCGIDRERASGLHRWKNMYLHVSNGLGTSRFVPFRLFCRPSATLLHIVEKPAYPS
ncbi:metallophosphoesterase [Corynebacterium poyangense]|uniref:Metallophosphoesterase n=1 Tax=Corynebacterium poyangense TaxID=2684405 RepID=A0A7H0SLL5_9CORY|nr:metallophosphoesterase [Corynebacterium poyangense]MBZ8177539.1 metallophosphoesterase [Corynebacterium poyangense]QNQ89440.1 metallophosphoesterase [Corynebacterium poyangense]